MTFSLTYFPFVITVPCSFSLYLLRLSQFTRHLDSVMYSLMPYNPYLFISLK